MDGDALIGTVIDGRFEIRDKLGQGGMGTVYRAWQRSVGREVAIKLIDRSISGDPMATRRFLREAHLASQLSHPNTISVLDVGQMPDGRLFTAMELLRGKTLGRELRERGAFSLDRVVRIGMQLCDALEAAHAQRIVHRDLKPDNVMLLDGGNDLIKVLDFGLAKALDDKSTQATAAGIVLGTLRYIAPESAMTGEATPASDMYAVGVILGELALGTPLWEGATLSIVLQHQMQPEPIVAKVPPPLREVVARLVDVKPQRRPNAAETRALLQRIRDGKPIEVEAAPAEPATVAMKRPAKAAPKSSRKEMLFVGGFLVFIASVVIAYLATRTSKPNAYNAPTSKPPTGDVWADDPRPAHADDPQPAQPADPWQTTQPPPVVSPRPADPAQPSLADIVKTIDAGVADKVRLTLVGVPLDYQVFINGRRKYTDVYYARVGERVSIEVWDADRTKLIATSTFTATQDEEIKLGR